MGQRSLGALWGVLMTAPKSFRKNAACAGFTPGPDQGDRIFQALLDTPQELWVGKTDPEDTMPAVKTPSGKIEIYIPEMEKVTRNLDAAGEADALNLPDNFPLILNAGRHMRTKINTLMRNPEWNKGRRACTISVNPVDAESLGLADGQGDHGSRFRNRRTGDFRTNKKGNGVNSPRIRTDL